MKNEFSGTLLSNVALGLALACLLSAQTALSQAYPDHVVKIIVPTGAGGAYDILGRTLAKKLTEQMGQSFFVENRVGAGTVVGTQAGVTAAPDGYTLLIGGMSNIVFNAGLYKNLPYDAVTGLAPLGLVANYPYTIAVRRDFPASTLKEFVELVRSKPGTYFLASAGAGTGQHIMAESFMKATGTQFSLVHYKGPQQPYADFVSGRLDAYFDNLTSIKPHVDGGRVKLLAMASAQRSTILPQLPTATELGFPGVVLDSWVGLFAPAKTPGQIVERLRTEVERAGSSPDVKSQIESSGAQPIMIAGKKSEAFIASEAAHWIPFIRQAGISAD